MIRLGLRLTLGGGKEAAVRLAVTAAAVALGVGMLLITLAGINALTAQNAPKENEGDLPGLVSCAQLSRTRALGRCAAGAGIASITPNLSGADTSRSQAETVWPAAASPPGASSASRSKR